MSNFGNVKMKLLNKLTESYTSDKKSEVKKILKQIKSDKNLSEMYMFYEDIENKNISNTESAKLFVEQVESLLIEKTKVIKESCKSLDKILGNVPIEKNEIYECLDVISEGNTLLNIEKKVESKMKLISHLTKEKTTQVAESSTHTDNQSLLNAVLVNNFNIKFVDFMNEDQKETFKKIVSMEESELKSEMESLRESLNTKIDSLLTESDNELSDKLTNVKNDVNQSTVSKYNYFRLIELKSSLD
jgi:hypothetical protein